jgi:hypothetical protein
MRTFWDGVNSDAPFIPTTAQGVMGYVPPSSFAWTAASWARFPNSTHVRITPSARVFGLGVQVVDVENGDATPAEAPSWATNSRNAGQDPTVYCSLSAWPGVQAAIVAARIPHPNYFIAHYDGDPNTMPVLNGITAVAKQYLNTNRYDLTSVPGVWPGVDTGGDTMEWTDTLTNPHNTAQVARACDLLWEVDLWAARNGAAIAGLTAAVAAATSNPAITPAALQQMIDTAVAQHVQISGTVQVGPAPAPAAS